MARQFGRWAVPIAAVAVATIVCIKLAVTQSRPQTKRASSVLPVPIDVATAPFDVHLSSGDIHGSLPSSERAAYFLALVVHDYSIYPPSFFRATGLESIVLCSDLSFDSQPRGAVPDFEHNILYFDVDVGSYDQVYQRHGLHHELFHIVDWRDDWALNEDEAWCKLNAKSFHYGNGGVALQSDSSAGDIQESESGFLTRYSMSGVEEDKAELFAFLIMSPKYVGKRAETDRVLAEKVARMKRLLVDFCPEIDSAFWRKAIEADPGTDLKPNSESIPIDNPQ